MVAADEVSIKVTGQNTSTPAIDSAKRSVKGLKDEAGETAVKVKVLGESVKETARKTDDLGDKARGTAREVSALDRKILELRASTLALGKEFEKTGDSSLLKKFRSDSRELAGLERMRKQIGSLAGDVVNLGKQAETTASTFTSLFQGGIINALQTPVGAGVAVGGGVAAGAAIGGATLAGGGVAAAGAAAAAGFAADPAKVGAAWTKEIDHIKAKWAEAGKVAVEPTIAAIHTIAEDIDAIHFDKIVSKGAQYLEPFARAAGTALRYVAAGAETLIDSAGPEMEVLAKEVPEVGRAIKEALEAISGGSEGGARALTDLFHVVEGVIVGTGNFIGGLETAYGWLGKASDAARDLSTSVSPLARNLNDLMTQGDGEVLAHRFKEASEAAGDATFTFNGLSIELKNTADAADAANAAFDRLFGEAMNLDQANLAVKEGMIQLRDELEKNGDTLSSNTQKGIDNQQAILGQIELLDRQRESAIAAGNGTKEATDAANSAFASQVEALRRVLIQMGFNAKEVDNLIAKYQQIPHEINTDVNTYYHNYYTSSNSPIGPEERKYGKTGKAAGGVVGAASGMVASGMLDVAERGREIALLAPGRAVLPPGSQVLSNANTEQVLARGGGRGQRIEIGFTGDLTSAYSIEFMRLVREGHITILSTAIVDAG